MDNWLTCRVGKLYWPYFNYLVSGYTKLIVVWWSFLETHAYYLHRARLRWFSQCSQWVRDSPDLDAVHQAQTFMNTQGKLFSIYKGKCQNLLRFLSSTILQIWTCKMAPSFWEKFTNHIPRIFFHLTLRFTLLRIVCLATLLMVIANIVQDEFKSFLTYLSISVFVHHFATWVKLFRHATFPCHND